MVPGRHAVLALLLGLAACSYQGGIDNPVQMRFHWYSYLNGDDLRAGCRPGSPFRARLVYNGHYHEQVRSYEVAAEPGGSGLLTARVLGPTGIDVRKLSLSDIQGPWRWTTAQTQLSEAEGEALVAALRDSGAFEPAPAGLRLYSNAFYWIVSGCDDGQVFFNAWQYPSPRWDRLAFPELLYRWDQTGVAVNPARKRDPSENFAAASGQVADDASNRLFQLRVGRDGLVGQLTVF